MKKTRIEYTEYLNKIGRGLDEAKFIIGGKMRKQLYPCGYGKAIRRYNPIAFNVGYNEWRLK
jgi:hypothetical protein